MCTVVPLYTATLTSAQPSYEATVFENKPFINISKLPLTSGHPSYTATIVIPQGWPHKRGSTVLPFLVYKCFKRDSMIMSLDKDSIGI